MTKNNQGQQTEKVKSHLANLIREGKLAPGDKLPSQVQLRKQLGVGSKTIQRALQTLAGDGIVELRKSRGVFLLRSDAGGYRGRKIGVVGMRKPDFVYANMQLAALLSELHDRGADVINFLRNEAPTGERDPGYLFPGLERSIERGALDGIISFVPLSSQVVELCEKHDVPLLYCGDRTYFPCTARHKGITQDALKRLDNSGCRRPAVIWGSQDTRRRHQKMMDEHFPQVMAFGENLEDALPHTQAEVDSEMHRIVSKFLSLAPEKRPDGVFIPDDFLATSFCMLLLLAREPLPRLIVQRTRQIAIPMYFPLIGWYEYDTERDARQIVDAVFEMITSRVRKLSLEMDVSFCPGSDF